jgi:hypothetical protein
LGCPGSTAIAKPASGSCGSRAAPGRIDRAAKRAGVSGRVKLASTGEAPKVKLTVAGGNLLS